MTQDMRHGLVNTFNGTTQHTNGSLHTLTKNGFSNGTNGHEPRTNGIDHSHTNGFAPTKRKSKPANFYGHDREEVVRLILQALGDLGYQETAEQLSHQSGYRVESAAVAAFRQAILDGQWSEAEAILFGEMYQPDGGGVSVRQADFFERGGLDLVDDAEPHHLKFMIREQKYIELLKRSRRGEALLVLQTELQPLKQDTQRLNILSGLLVSDPSDEAISGTLIGTRQDLLIQISRFISPSIMIPQHRLAELLDQVHRGQVAKCLYHNPSVSRPASLFVDHMCDQNDFPLKASLELTQTDGEVWFVEFSHDGRFLAACGESRAVVIYDTRTFDVRHKLLEHTGHVVYLTWSPDDTKLITCCRDAKARIWDVASGRCMQIIDHHEQCVTTAAWTPDGSSIITGSLDKQSQLVMRAADARGEAFNWPTELRTQDLAITPDGQRLVVMSTENYITVYNLRDRTEHFAIKVAQRMTSLSISRDSRTMLVNMANDEIHLIDIETAGIVRRYTGQRQDGFIIRSTFGGTDEGLIVSGSSDSKVYIWHKQNGTLIETLEGHTYGCVNAVSWNPSNPTMFASCGDDKKVRIWTKDPDQSSILRRRVSSHNSHRHSL